MTVRKITAIIISAVICISAFVGCADNERPDSKINAESNAAKGSGLISEEEKKPETEKEWNNAMMKKAMVSYGNTYLVQKAIKKAQSGSKTTVAYLGGSITEGVGADADNCYAKLSFDYFAEKFGKDDNVKYCNAGLSGTPSRLGILRLNRDVLQYDPDIVFIEYAVNDANDQNHQNAYESIVRTLLEKNIAVVLLFSVTKDNYSAEDYMKQIGEYYNLPMISYCDALRFLFENKQLTWDEFSNDDAHPNFEGHKLVASMIDYYFDTVMDNAPKGEYVMPDGTVFSPREQKADLCENTTLTPESLGSWSEETQNTGFTNGWTHIKGENKPLIFKIKAKFLYLIFKEVKGGNFGKVHVKITKADGKLYDETDYDSTSDSGWGGPQVINILMEPDEQEYKVEISMADGDEDKTYQLLGIGYTKE